MHSTELEKLRETLEGKKNKGNDRIIEPGLILKKLLDADTHIQRVRSILEKKQIQGSDSKKEETILEILGVLKERLRNDLIKVQKADKFKQLPISFAGTAFNTIYKGQKSLLIFNTDKEKTQKIPHPRIVELFNESKELEIVKIFVLQLNQIFGLHQQ